MWNSSVTEYDSQTFRNTDPGKSTVISGASAKISVIFVMLLVLLFLGPARITRAEEARGGPFRAVPKIPEGAVVPLEVLGPVCDGGQCTFQPVSRGSAVCIDRRGGAVILLTARHCLPEKPREMLQVYLRGIWVKASCWKTSKFNADVAILEAKAADCDELACLADTRPTRGQPVTLTGYTHGRTYQAITGVVSEPPPDDINDRMYDWCSLPQKRFGSEVYGGSVVEGQSGGGVFDQLGNLVGIACNRDGDSPWMGRYVALDELHRLLAASGLIVRPAWRQAPEPGSAGGLSQSSGPRMPPKSDQATAPEKQPTPVAPPDDGSTVQPFRVPADLEEASPAVPMAPGRVQPLEVKPLGGSATDQEVLKPAGEPKNLLNLSKILGEIQGKMAETQGKPPVTTPVSSEKSDPKDTPQKSPWDFWASLVPLGVSIAGTVATGGTGWMMLVRPTLKTIQEGIEVIQSAKEHQASGNVSRPAPPAISPVVTSAAADQPPLPIVVTKETPPTSVVHTETRFAPVQVDHVSRAFSFAIKELTESSPMAAGPYENLRNLMNQYLSGAGTDARV